MGEPVRKHPLQVSGMPKHMPRTVNAEVAMAAYEVYAHVYGKQEAMITPPYRGGFGAAETIAFLYARSFPKAEWSKRIDEALTGTFV